MMVAMFRPARDVQPVVLSVFPKGTQQIEVRVDLSGLVRRGQFTRRLINGVHAIGKTDVGPRRGIARHRATWPQAVSISCEIQSHNLGLRVTDSKEMSDPHRLLCCHLEPTTRQNRRNKMLRLDCSMQRIGNRGHERLGTHAHKRVPRRSTASGLRSGQNGWR